MPRWQIHSVPCRTIVRSSAALLFAACAPICLAQSAPAAARIAAEVIHQPTAAAWNADSGFRLEGLAAAWYASANGDDFRYLERTIDAVLNTGNPAGTDSRTLGLFGSRLLLLYRVTLDPRYFQAAEALRRQLGPACGLGASHPAPASAWDCQAQPFLAEYAAVFPSPGDFAGLTRTFQAQSRTLGASSGNLAWQAVALVDALPYYPSADPSRPPLLAILRRLAPVLSRAAIPHQQPASLATTCLAVYALLKGVRMGYLPASYDARAMSAWHAVAEQLATGANLLEPASLLLAATEADLEPINASHRGETILVDAWFNSQTRQNAAGQIESFHYKWPDFSDSGYSLLGHMFRSYGVATGTLASAPTLARLSAAQLYLIVSPDIPVKNPHPHYMTTQDADQIAAWVHDGGVLILMENDPPNADIEHLNLLADRFGIHFDNVLHHHIIGEQVEDGRIPVAASGPLFHHAHTLYMKDTCAISLRRPAGPLLRDRGDIVMATARYGRGAVFAAVDPWLYNEYTDGRKDSRTYGQFDNFAGGQELVRWLLDQVPAQRGQGKRP